MPSPNRQDKNFKCPTCDEPVGVFSSAKPRSINNNGSTRDFYKRYRVCPLHGKFTTLATSKKSDDEKFHQWTKSKEAKWKGGGKSFILDLKSLRIRPELKAQIIRSPFHAGYFSNGMTVGELNAEAERVKKLVKEN